MMMAYLGAAFIILAFSRLLVTFGLVERARQIGGASREAMAVLSNSALDDDAKEKAMRGHSVALFSGFLRLTAGLLAALLLPTLAVWLLSLVHIWSFDEVIAASLSWPLILGGLLVFIFIVWRARGGVQE
ncbi:MAG: hypothetical protein AB7V46_03135 [Thermomicrobiales bacterium]